MSALIPYSQAHGALLSLRDDDRHDNGCMCAWRVPEAIRWQQGDPTTDLPAAPRWHAPNNRTGVT